MHPTPPGRLSQRLLYLGGALLALLLLSIALLTLAIKTERGTRFIWNAATSLVPGLSGELTAGTFLRGVHLKDFAYRDASRQINADAVEGQWQVDLRPLALTVDSLQVGQLDVTLFPDEQPASPPPQRLVLPLALDARDVAIERLNLHRGEDITRIENVHISAQSDRVHHVVNLKNAATPWGIARTELRVDGDGPVKIAATASVEGRLLDEPFKLAAQLTGAVESLDLKLQVQGERLRGHADIAATPFARLPFTHADVNLEHLNPRLFSPSAPRADLDVMAKLIPSNDEQGALKVSGPVSLRNATPGTLDRQLLPLVSASAQVKLDQQFQQLTDLRIALNGGATATGTGHVRTGKQGQLHVEVRQLNLRALHAPVSSQDPLNSSCRGSSCAMRKHDMSSAVH
jgi:translocation and assembly module TamB